MDAIVYTSGTGHTKAYAEMLSKAIHLPVYELKSALRELPQGTSVIYLGWLMAGTVSGYKKARSRFEIWLLCGVGMAKTGSQVEDIKKANKTPAHLPVFSLQGGFEMEKLHGVYRVMMQTMKNTVGKKLSQKTDRTAEEDEMLDLLINGGNRVSQENLSEILTCYEAQTGEKVTD